VIEDLHWADRSTLDLLAFLVRNLRRERMLVVVTYRNDEPGRQRLGPYLAELDRADRVMRIELARLDQAETVAQLVGILGATPAADLADAVFTRSEGNPFFTEELLGSVRAGSAELPATLRDLLRGRVQALPDPARQLLAVVAVAGRRVPHRLLAEVAGRDDDTLVAMLRIAVADQLLVIQPGEDGYQFRHALLREVVAADLLPGERIRLHGEYAKALAGRPELAGAVPAVAAAELAAHWDGAGEPIRALPAWIAAGRAAAHARAFAEADRHYRRALELWEQVTDPDRLAGLDRVELLAQRGRLRLQEPVDAAALPKADSPAASLGLTQREAEVLALVAEGRTNRQIGQALFIPRRRPASTSPASWPSWGWPVAVRRPRSPTGSASTNNDPAWPLAALPPADQLSPFWSRGGLRAAEGQERGAKQGQAAGQTQPQAQPHPDRPGAATDRLVDHRGHGQGDQHGGQRDQRDPGGAARAAAGLTEDKGGRGSHDQTEAAPENGVEGIQLG
jgi:hypothetical protein